MVAIFRAWYNGRQVNQIARIALYNDPLYVALLTPLPTAKSTLQNQSEFTIWGEKQRRGFEPFVARQL